mmetsp:Transcript_68934/g.154368  ORF Transcript_68934/g.154368 Transcript_68934/m.154368 type:complete len:220 (-) Transcript_68934:163-822(-)
MILGLMRFAGSLDEELVVPVGEEEAEHADHATVDRVQLEGLVEVGVPFFTVRRLHQVEPEEQRAHHKDVEGPIADDEVHAVRSTEAVRPGLDDSYSRSDARHEEGRPRHGKPQEVHKQHLCIIRQLAVIVLVVAAQLYLVVLYGWQHGEHVVAYPRDGDTQDNRCEGLELHRVSHSGSVRTAESKCPLKPLHTGQRRRAGITVRDVQGLSQRDRGLRGS